VSPTQQTLALFRGRGYVAAVVERWNHHARIRQDLFGCLDVVAVGNGETVGVQACAYSDIAKRVRDLRQRAEFRRVHPCPATGKIRGACPGYVVDHRKPLCAGGRDAPDNMQWQTVADAKAKDLAERLQCRR
jgi:hypothetical protein